MKTQIQLILATAVLTVLIWVYADQQGYKNVQFPVAVSIASLPDIVPRIVEATDTATPNLLHISVTARGPNAVIRELDLNGPRAFQVSVPVMEDATPGGPRAVDIHDAIAAALREEGLQLLRTDRATVAVFFDQRVRVNLDVVADAGTFNEAVSGNFTIAPPTVTAIVLASELQALTATGESRLAIPIEEELRARRSQNAFMFTVSLRTRKWQGLNVTWEPDEVTFRGRFTRQFDERELKLIPLRVLLPWNWPADKYDVVLADERDRLQKVTVKVPVGHPTTMTNSDVMAFITIDESLIPTEAPVVDASAPPPAEPSPYSQRVRFVFTEGFQDVQEISSPVMVKFRIVPRATAEVPTK